jgi:hypothetical protein
MAKKSKKKDEDNEMDQFFSKEEQLSMENEMLKLKIETELGGQMHQMGGMDIPPELENMFLSQIYNFQKQIHNSKKISIFEFLGSPKMMPVDSITDKKILKEELKKVEKMLKKKRIILDRIYKYKDDVIYKYLTEEFMKHEIDDIAIPEGFFHFIYEEMVPNHEMDVKELTMDTIHDLFNKEIEKLNPHQFSKSLIFNGAEMSFEEFEKYFYNISDFVPELEHIKMGKMDLDLENSEMMTGEMTFKLTYVGGVKETSKLGFKNEFGMWEVNRLEFAVLKSK